MKAYFITILFMVSFSTSYADNFQFYFKTSGNSAYASYQSVKIYNGKSGVIFSGFTDKFGRLAINLRPGSYSGIILYQKREYKITLVIDNKKDYKIIYFGSSIRPYLIRKV